MASTSILPAQVYITIFTGLFLFNYLHLILVPSLVHSDELNNIQLTVVSVGFVLGGLYSLWSIRNTWQLKSNGLLVNLVVMILFSVLALVGLFVQNLAPSEIYPTKKIEEYNKPLDNIQTSLFLLEFILGACATLKVLRSCDKTIPNYKQRDYSLL